MKAKLLTTTLLVASLYASACNAETILQSVKAAVSLSVTTKFSDRRPDVDFEVVQPSGQVSKATAIAENGGERPGDVTYPDDFTNAGMHPGTYKWTATADGKELSSGTFEYLPTENGFQVRVPNGD